MAKTGVKQSLSSPIPWYRSFEAHIRLLRRFAAANQVPVVDLPHALRDIGESRDVYFVDEVHPNGDLESATEN